MSSANKQANYNTMQLFVGALGVVTLVLAAAVVILLLRPVVVVTNFEQCKEAGGTLLESYPEQCQINGATFVDTGADDEVTGNDGYIGLSEKAALEKAEQANVPARVVERDGKALPATMDLRHGRHNFFVRDGKVYKVNVEDIYR